MLIMLLQLGHHFLEGRKTNLPFAFSVLFEYIHHQALFELPLGVGPVLDVQDSHCFPKGQKLSNVHVLTLVAYVVKSGGGSYFLLLLAVKLIDSL